VSFLTVLSLSVLHFERVFTLVWRYPYWSVFRHSWYIILALGYLYSSQSLHAIQSHNARAVLAAGCLLGGMEELCEYAYETCKRSISVDTINSWLEFIDRIPAASNGIETPDVSPVSVFGFYAQRIRDDVFHFLVVTLPEILELNSPSVDGNPSSPELNGREVLLQVFSRYVISGLVVDTFLI